MVLRPVLDEMADVPIAVPCQGLRTVPALSNMDCMRRAMSKVKCFS